MCKTPSKLELRCFYSPTDQDEITPLMDLPASFSLSLPPHQHSYSTLPPSELWMEWPLVFLLLTGLLSTQCTLLYMHTSHLNTEQNGMEWGGIRSNQQWGVLARDTMLEFQAHAHSYLEHLGWTLEADDKTIVQFTWSAVWKVTLVEGPRTQDMKVNTMWGDSTKHKQWANT